MNPALIDAPVPGTAPARVPARRWSATNARSPGSATAPKPPWWLWPHLLSFDAPLVAVVWQRWLAWSAGVALPPSRAVVLGLGVWLIYLADRLADSAGGGHSHAAAPRHVFSGQRRRFLQPLTLLAGAALTTLTPYCLSRREFTAGLGLLALAVGYFWLIHCWPARGWAAFLPKEAVVGAMFGVGTAFFVVCRSSRLPGAEWWSGAILFGTVCFLNCAFITRWERQARDLRERSSLLNAFPRLCARLGAVSVAVAVAALAVSWATASVVAVPVAASALLLTGLDRCKSRLSSDALRVLADLVLLTPWLGWALASAMT